MRGLFERVQERVGSIYDRESARTRALLVGGARKSSTIRSEESADPLAAIGTEPCQRIDRIH